MRLRLGTGATLMAAIAAIVYLALPQSGNYYQCLGARPCMFCARLPAHRDPCFGGCPRGGQCQLILPVDGYCPDERPIAAGKVILYAKDIQKYRRTKSIYVVVQISDALLTLLSQMVNGDHV